jgi:hypothetical protein
LATSAAVLAVPKRAAGAKGAAGRPRRSRAGDKPAFGVRDPATGGRRRADTTQEYDIAIPTGEHETETTRSAV